MRRPTSVWLAIVSAGLLAASAVGCSSSSTGSSAKPDKDTFCALLVAFRASNDALASEVSSGDPAKTQVAVQRLVGQVQTLQQRAPADILPDVTATATFLTQLQSLLASFSYDLTKLQADPAAVEKFATLNSDAVQASLDQLRAYGDTDCAIAPGTTASSSSG
jgi:hypothetical protein